GHSVSAAVSGPKPQYRGPEEDEGQGEICDPTAHALRLHVQHGTVPLVKGPKTPRMGLEGLHVPCPLASRPLASRPLASRPLASCPLALAAFNAPAVGRGRLSWSARLAGGPIKWARKRLNRQRRPCRGSVAGRVAGPASQALAAAIGPLVVAYS